MGSEFWSKDSQKNIKTGAGLVGRGKKCYNAYSDRK